MQEASIQGGATLWARQTVESEIFCDKPDKWFKIWFYLVNRVSHKDTKKYKRGECFLQYEWIAEHTKATPDQIKKCIAWLKGQGMVSTRRSTRGVWLEIPKYSHFQTLDNYYYGVKAPDEALEKHQRSTREAPRYNKNDKNDKNTIDIGAKAPKPVKKRREDIDELLNGIKQLVGVIDGSKQEQRNFAKNFLDSKTPEILRQAGNGNPSKEQILNATLRIFQLAKDDSWHRKNVNSLKYVYNKAASIVAGSKNNNEKYKEKGVVLKSAQFDEMLKELRG